MVSRDNAGAEHRGQQLDPARTAIWNIKHLNEYGALCNSQVIKYFGIRTLIVATYGKQFKDEMKDRKRHFVLSSNKYSGKIIVLLTKTYKLII